MPSDKKYKVAVEKAFWKKCLFTITAKTKAEAEKKAAAEADDIDWDEVKNHSEDVWAALHFTTEEEK